MSIYHSEKDYIKLMSGSNNLCATYRAVSDHQLRHLWLVEAGSHQSPETRSKFCRICSTTGMISADSLSRPAHSVCQELHSEIWIGP